MCRWCFFIDKTMTTTRSITRRASMPSACRREGAALYWRVFENGTCAHAEPGWWSTGLRFVREKIVTRSSGSVLLRVQRSSEPIDVLVRQWRGRGLHDVGEDHHRQSDRIEIVRFTHSSKVIRRCCSSTSLFTQARKR